MTPAEWTTLIVAIGGFLGAIGVFIAHIFSAAKTRAETKALKSNQKKILEQVTNNGGSSMKDSADAAKDAAQETLALAQSLSLRLISLHGDVSHLRERSDRHEKQLDEVKMVMTNHLLDAPAADLALEQRLMKRVITELMTVQTVMEDDDAVQQ